MIIIFSAAAVVILSIIIGKKVIIKRLQSQYEKSLLKGDRKKAVHLGRLYYLSLDESTRKAKGIIDIEAKISDDFRAFNSRHFSFLM